MAGYMGYASEAEYQKAIDRELALMEYHDTGGRTQPKAQAEQKVKLRGKPGSPERLKQVAEASGASVKQVQSDWARTQAGQRLVKAVTTMREVGFVGEEFMAAVDSIIALENVDVLEQTLYALPPEIGESLQDALIQRVYETAQRQERAAEKAEDARIERRAKVLEQEYEYAERLGGEDVLRIVDDEMNAVDPEVLYSEEMDDETLRLASRTTAEAALAARKAVNNFSTVAAISEEIKRGVGAPGSSWNDQEREAWSAELDEAAVHAYERELGQPHDVTVRAIESLHPSKPSFTEKFTEELDRLSTPPAHRDRLRDLAVTEWESQHPEKR